MSFEIEKTYEAKKYENKIYAKWEKSGAFKPKANKKKKPFVISMPPPNATGVLHLGHAVMLALEDIMTRHHRMMGEPALWLPGTDHAAIATQNKVEQLLSKQGKSRHDLGRTAFLKEVEKFVENSKSTIRNQIRKMGSSCDWSRERYTMDEGLTAAVTETFVRMHKEGLIYRGDRIVNWCPRCGSVLANDEVEYKTVTEKLYWIKYGPFILATTRPETKLGDTAVAVHPSDARYKKMVGKKYMIPGVLGEFEITVVADHAVDPAFGSGAVKVTPAHSFTDFEIAQRHNIPAKSVIDEQGRMMANCGKYAGMTTLECRIEIVKDMEKMGLIEKIEDYEHNLSICYRCDHVIEPLISKQWFVSVDKPAIKVGSKKVSLKKWSIDVVKKNKIKILPTRFNKTYFHWMENLHDWCISRQIWFGHRMPVWYCQKCGEVIVTKARPTKCPKCKSTELKQDPDTLDTWFSSGQWTYATLGWPQKTADLKYFHPTSVMETGYDILFFWVARMILMTGYTMKDIPFHTVYLHGLIRDKFGQKMSKSRPETCIDPLEMIEKYGTDAVRLSLVIGSTPGNDMRLFEEKIAGYRNFINKIWNAARFALMNVEPQDLKKKFEPKMVRTLADKWILTKLQKLIKEVDEDMSKFRFSDAGIKIYDFLWGMYCDWYLEISKGEHKNPAVLLHVLKETLKLLHPFVPFVTEKLWEFIDPKNLLISSEWPKYTKKLIFPADHKAMETILEIINKIRSIRSDMKVEPGKKIHAIIYAKNLVKTIEAKREPLMRMARLEKLEVLPKGPKIPKSQTAVISGVEIYLPLKDLVDTGKEKLRLEKEIKLKEGLIVSLKSKLNNPGFVKNAPPELVTQNEIRLSEEEETLAKLKEQLQSL